MHWGLCDGHGRSTTRFRCQNWKMSNLTNSSCQRRTWNNGRRLGTIVFSIRDQDAPNLTQKHIEFHKQIEHKIQQIPIHLTNSLLDAPMDVLISPIQQCELTKCIQDLEKDKAFEPAVIHNQMIINEGPKLWYNF